MNAVVVQALGIASSFAVLTQIRAAGFMPRSVYAALAAVVGLQVRPLLQAAALGGRCQWQWPVDGRYMAAEVLRGVPAAANRARQGALPTRLPPFSPCLTPMSTIAPHPCRPS